LPELEDMGLEQIIGEFGFRENANEPLRNLGGWAELVTSFVEKHNVYTNFSL
jgi:hypothetical protein